MFATNNIELIKTYKNVTAWLSENNIIWFFIFFLKIINTSYHSLG